MNRIICGTAEKKSTTFWPTPQGPLAAAATLPQSRLNQGSGCLQSADATYCQLSQHLMSLPSLSLQPVAHLAGVSRSSRGPGAALAAAHVTSIPLSPAKWRTSPGSTSFLPAECQGPAFTCQSSTQFRPAACRLLREPAVCFLCSAWACEYGGGQPFHCPVPCSTGAL